MKKQLKVLRLLRKSLLFVTLIFVFQSCNNNSNEYYSEFKQYMLDIHNIRIDDKKVTFLVFNVNCLDCLGKNHLNGIKEFENKTKLIIVGKPKTKQNINIVNDIITKTACLYDIDNLAAKYALNLSKVLLIKIEAGKCTMYKSFTSFMPEEINKLI